MRWRQALGIALLFAAIAAVAAYLTWAFRAGSRIGPSWATMLPYLPYLFAGVVTVEIVIGGFVWLAIYSERRGYDDRAGVDPP
jgi:hypothetical protein